LQTGSNSNDRSYLLAARSCLTLSWFGFNVSPDSADVTKRFPGSAARSYAWPSFLTSKIDADSSVA
jgi:hypothetical protein